ncbi:macrolide-specific efflux system membrane fusion protein [Actinoplanes lutulentus]|uniref:Macrolide-specific efflux system membrane fusion protein n=1 Tax=Actinoplanes lutulentus TaxID=1287878 RepID=A0A327Z9L3_9ACTN|nr:efflux RND transporter periplasmic adaptor subunit [Actinoplanes lutulentus]MBB2946823.1 macrolide-specific efflux system membrane fusion protein [Actinoplanes lutulentus]RAK35715.1 macrolide-specific efflux system membrane fusion protein [Actinoplanes lutulentus]
MNALLALLIVGAAFWGWTLLRDTDSDTEANASGLRTLTVDQGTVTKTVSADGSVESASTATATFTTSGTVTTIKVKVGDKVTSGQLLARVDATDSERSLDLAEANLDAAQDALDRAEDAGTDTSSATNEVTQAELSVDEAEAAVTGTKLTAPMAGTVTAVNGTLGGASSSGGGSGTTSSSTSSGFVDLADLGKLQITAAFSEADATELKEGQSATVTWNALQGTETTGQVIAVDPTATTTNSVVTYGVTVSLPNPPDGAKPGQTVSVAVITGNVENAVMVNSAAVTSTGNRKTVTVLGTDNQQETRQVQVGLEGDDAYQITSGLTAGERVIVPTATTTTTTTNSGGGGGFGSGGGGAPPGGGSGTGGGMGGR